jgi:hypothetical protein
MDIKRELRNLVPEKVHLHGRNLVTHDYLKYMYTDNYELREHVNRDLAYDLSNLILDDKKDAFTESEHPEGRLYSADLVVFSPDEWRKYQSDLYNLFYGVQSCPEIYE